MEDILIEQRTDNNSEKIKKRVVKPVVKIRKKQTWLSYFANLFNKTAIVSLLLWLDFVLFCRAGYVNIFGNAPWFLSANVQYILLGIVAISFFLMFISSFLNAFQNLTAALVVSCIIGILISQFALFDRKSFLFDVFQKWVDNEWIEHLKFISHWVVLIICFVMAWLFFAFSSKRKQFYTVILLMIISVVLMVDLYNHRNEKNDFTEVYADKVIASDKKGNNFVFIAMPNLPSYRYLERISPKYPAAKNTLNAMLGLYTRNGFMLYTNAYTVANTKFENLAQSLNMETEGNLLGGRAKYDDNWNFKQISSKRPELLQNKLSALFEKNGYIRKAFEDRNIELCSINQKQIFNSCVRREMMPYIPDNLDIRSRTMMLLGQWLGSMDIFSTSPRLYAMLKFLGVEDVPFVGVDYAEIPALGSLEILDVVAEDIAAGKENRAYIVWLSMPEEEYIYDEFCQIKPITEWVVNGGKNVAEDKRMNAYFEQTSCVFGKLADFMRKIKEAGMNENTVVFLQGVSGLEMTSLKKIDNFEAQHMVTMAIRDPKHNKFTINKQFCSAPKIIKQYLFKKEKCVEQEGLNFDNNLRKEILERIENHNVINKTSIDTLNASGEWFRNWMRANYNDMLIPIEMPVEPEIISKAENKPSIENVVKQDVTEAVSVKEIKLHTVSKNLETNAEVKKEEQKTDGEKYIENINPVANEKIEDVKQVIINNENTISDNIETQQPETEKLLPGEEVVVLPQGENKADKIIIRINETEEEKQAQVLEKAKERFSDIVATEKVKAQKLALETQIKTEKITAEAIAKVETALGQESVDELGIVSKPASSEVK